MSEISRVFSFVGPRHATVYQGKSLSRTQVRENLESGGLSVVVHVNLWWITKAHVRTSAYWAMAPGFW